MNYDKIFKPLTVTELCRVRDALLLLEDKGFPGTISEMLFFTLLEIERRQKEEEDRMITIARSKRSTKLMKTLINLLTKGEEADESNDRGSEDKV